MAKASRHDFISDALSGRAAVSLGVPARAEPVPARRRQRREALGEAGDEAVDAGRVRQAVHELCGDLDREPRRAVGGGHGLGLTLALNSSRGGRAQMLDLRAGRGERRSALCLGCRGGGAQSLGARVREPRRLGVGGVARRIRLTLRRFCVGEELHRRDPPLFDDRRNRTEQEPAQDQHQNQDVERLQPERPPVDPHRGRSLT